MDGKPRATQDLERLSVKELRQLLSDKGVNSSACVEKADFVFLAQTIGLDGCSSTASTAEPRSRSRSLSLKSELSWSSARSKSRGRSRSKSRSSKGGSQCGESDDDDDTKKPADWGVDLVRITADDAAGLQHGTYGKALDKIAMASEAEVEINHKDLVLEVRGTRVQRRRARKYAESVMRKRTGPLLVTEDFDDGDLTVLSVPADVVGYVQGHGGSVLRTIEEEWGTLMFFIDSNLSRAQRLAIFGSIRGRRGSELKVLSAIEMKVPGNFMCIYHECFYRDQFKDDTGTWGTDYMIFNEDGELSYALGKKGSTRRKLERSSGAVVQYIGNYCITSGTKTERSQAREYMKWLFQQLEGPVYVDGWKGRTDCTVVDIPTDCIGYITGNRRATLGLMEEEWGTLMFFMNETEKGRGRGGTECLAIFGSERPRRGSELKVMSGIETKSPGFFTRGLRAKTSNKKGFDTDRLLFQDEEVSYALGKEGATRKKLEQTSGAILQYVGHVAFIGGTLKERRRCREYVNWLLQQRRGSVTITDTKNRDDVTEVHIPTSCKGWVTGNRGSELRTMEQASGTFMFMANDARGDERLLIFGVNKGTKEGEGGRLHAERLVNAMIDEALRNQDVGSRGRWRSRSRSRSRKRSRSRRRSRSRSGSRGRRRNLSPSRGVARNASPPRGIARNIGVARNISPPRGFARNISPPRQAARNVSPPRPGRLRGWDD